MKRNDFSIESEIVGQSFSDLIDKKGGKVAGTMLLEKLLQDWNMLRPRSDWSFSKVAKRVLNNRWSSERLTVPYFEEIDTNVYHTLEQKLLSSKGSDKVLKYSIKNTLANNQDVMNLLTKIDKNKNGLFRHNENHIHIRTSSTIEDWRDDSYSGVFYSQKVVRTIPNMLSALTENYFHFFKIKQDKHFNIPKDASTAMMIMRSAQENQTGEMHQRQNFADHLTIYSGYPEITHSPAIIEGMDLTFPWATGHELVQQSEQMLDHIQVGDDTYYFALEKGNTKHEQLRFPFSINNERTFLHKDTIDYFKAFTDYLRFRLQKEVNLEAISITRDYGTFTDLVQLRPVPTIDNFKPLEPLSEEYIEIASTPLVQGVFDYEMKLTTAHKGSY